MQRADLYVIAAGSASRLNVTVPKALVAIEGSQPCLTSALRHIGSRFDRLFIVTNAQVQSAWHEYFAALDGTDSDIAAKVVPVPIHSGLGDGHAVLQGLLESERIAASGLCEEVVVIWGDVVFTGPQIIDEMLSLPRSGPGLIPALWERNPYVTLQVNGRMQCSGVDFSKHGERHDEGYHDQSVFRFSRSQLQASLSRLHEAFWKIDRYICSGRELSLLHTLHHFHNLGDPAYVYRTHHATRSFNTLEELEAIQQKLA